MARLLSTSPAIPAPKTANVYIPIETPQLQVPTSSPICGRLHRGTSAMISRKRRRRLGGWEWG